MLLLGGGATGVWLASTGLVRLERRFMIALGGTCSFCGKDRAQVQTLFGQRGIPERICDECVGLCFDIVWEDQDPMVPTPSEGMLLAEADDDAVADTLQELAAAQNSRHVDELVDRFRRSLLAERPYFREFQCSFCARSRSDVAKLISGPRVFICDVCVGDAVAISGIARGQARIDALTIRRARRRRRRQDGTERCGADHQCRRKLPRREGTSRWHRA
jgi:hypothetical protein